jgi:nucleotide-binding universal stress UspA family protein
VVTSTHSHKGLKHFVLGSFAETLLLYSDVPLLFINPNLKGASRPKHILFPTDFSEASKEAFQEVLKLAKSINGNVSLFHKIDFTLPPIIALNTRAYPLYKKAFVAEIGSKKNTATDWAKIAAAKGIRTKIIIDSKREGSLAEVILAQSKRNPGIIAMAAKSGPVMSALLGSTIRKVVRESSIPVWVLHPKDGANSQKQPLYVLTTEDVEGDLRRLPHCLDAS